MARTDSAMKIKVDADATGVKKGMKEAEAAIKSFDKSSSDALSSLASAFGINIGKIGEMSQAFSGAAASIAKGAGASSTAIAGISSAVSAFGGVAAVAIGGVVAKFRDLNQQADHFLNSMDGMAKKQGSQAFIENYKATLLELTGDPAKAGQRKTNWQESWARYTANLGATLRAQSGFDTNAAKDLSSAFEKAEENGEKARKYAKLIFEATENLDNAAVLVENLQAKVNQNLAIVNDPLASQGERMSALNNVKQLYTDIRDAQYGDLATIAAYTSELNKLTATSKEADDAADAAAKAFAHLNAEFEANMKTIPRLEARIKRAGGSSGSGSGKGSVKEETPFIPMDISGRMAKFAEDVKKTFSSNEAQEKLAASIQDSFKDMKPIPIDIEVRPLVQINGEEVTDMIKDFATDTLSSFGNAIGGALMGENGAFANFGSEMLNGLGAFAQKFGGLLVAMGTAGLALKDFYLNPTAAIAAGAALIVVGAAVSHMASSLGGGSYSAASVGGSYSPGGVAYGADMSTRELNVSVSGRLVASGSQLVAVLDSENARKKHTT